jgi:hypothetical protein
MFEIEKQFPLMPNEYQVQACRWVFEKKTGGALSPSDLADITVRAWARHRVTNYDDLICQLRLEGFSWEEAKSQAREQVRTRVNSIVDGWRKSAVYAQEDSL